MSIAWRMLFVALVISAIGFYKYVWFISIGYGFSIAGIGLMLLCWDHAFALGPALGIASLLFVIYGCRLGGYLAIRELKSASYNKKMATEIKDGKSMPIVARCGIWVSAAILYVCETAPVFYRVKNGIGSGTWLSVGIVVMLLGLCLESAADLQKNAAKKKNPRRFVDTGLYKIVRCPNYFGEMTFWTGVFLSGIGSNTGAIQWGVSIVGYVGIIYVMFGGARRLEMRQNRTYGKDPAYQAYVKTTPIMIPLIPLYSVEKYKWLVA